MASPLLARISGRRATRTGELRASDEQHDFRSEETAEETWSGDPGSRKTPQQLEELRSQVESLRKEVEATEDELEQCHKKTWWSDGSFFRSETAQMYASGDGPADAHEMMRAPDRQTYLEHQLQQKRSRLRRYERLFDLQCTVTEDEMELADIFYGRDPAARGSLKESMELVRISGGESIDPAPPRLEDGTLDLPFGVDKHDGAVHATHEAVLPCTVRADWHLQSDVVGKLEVGEAVRVVETHKPGRADEPTRVRIEVGPEEGSRLSGWVSLRSRKGRDGKPVEVPDKQGKLLLAPVEPRVAEHAPILREDIARAAEKTRRLEKVTERRPEMRVSLEASTEKLQALEARQRNRFSPRFSQHPADPGMQRHGIRDALPGGHEKKDVAFGAAADRYCSFGSHMQPTEFTVEPPLPKRPRSPRSGSPDSGRRSGSAGSLRFTIRVPQNATPGQKIEVKAPNGASTTITMPDDVRGGMEMRVSVPKGSLMRRGEKLGQWPFPSNDQIPHKHRAKSPVPGSLSPRGFGAQSPTYRGQHARGVPWGTAAENKPSMLPPEDERAIPAAVAERLGEGSELAVAEQGQLAPVGLAWQQYFMLLKDANFVPGGRPLSLASTGGKLPKGVLYKEEEVATGRGADYWRIQDSEHVAGAEGTVFKQKDYVDLKLLEPAPEDYEVESPRRRSGSPRRRRGKVHGALPRKVFIGVREQIGKLGGRSEEVWYAQYTLLYADPRRRPGSDPRQRGRPSDLKRQPEFHPEEDIIEQSEGPVLFHLGAESHATAPTPTAPGTSPSYRQIRTGRYGDSHPKAGQPITGVIPEQPHDGDGPCPPDRPPRCADMNKHSGRWAPPKSKKIFSEDGQLMEGMGEGSDMKIAKSYYKFAQLDGYSRSEPAPPREDKAEVNIGKTRTRALSRLVLLCC